MQMFINTLKCTDNLGLAENNRVARIIKKRRTKRRGQQYVRDILKTIFFGGVIYVAASSPYFITRLMKLYFCEQKYKNKNFSSAFDYLKKNDLIRMKLTFPVPPCTGA